MSFAASRLIAFHWGRHSPESQLNLPKEIRRSEIRKRRGSAATAESKSGLLMRGGRHRRGWRKSRRALGAVICVVSLIDRGTGGRFIVTVGLTRIESRAHAATRGPGDLGPIEGAERGCGRRRDW